MKVELIFDQPQDATAPGLDGRVIRFPFVVRRIREGALRDEVAHHSISVSISGTLLTMWGFRRWHEHDADVIKTLFEFARQHVVSKINDQSLRTNEQVDLRTNTAPRENPFDPTKIPDPSGATIPLEVEEPMENARSVASSPRSDAFGKNRARAEPPNEILDSLRRFREDYPEREKTAFIMMQFGSTSAHDEIVAAIQEALDPYGIKALRADDKDYHDDLFSNILTYVFGATFGIAVFERIEADDFNPNVALEVGYMLGLRKPVCLLKDKTLKSLHTDLVGKLYKVFDPLDPAASVPSELVKWMQDRSIVPAERPDEEQHTYSFTCHYNGVSSDIQSFSQDAFDFGATTRITKEFSDGTADIQFAYKGAYPPELFDQLADKHGLMSGPRYDQDV